jgi:hypothetical protein
LKRARNKPSKKLVIGTDSIHPAEEREGSGAAETEREKGEALSYYKLCPPSKTHSQLDNSKA